MTDNELKELVASLAIDNKEIRKSQMETSQQMKKTDEQMSRTDEQMIKLKKQVEDTSITLKYLGLNVDGINKTTDLETEEFFFSSFKKNKTLKNITFDSISPNLEVRKNERKHEMDIFLENGSSVGIIEVKNRVKEKDLEQLQKIVDNFYYFHPMFKNHKIIPAIAGKIFPQHIQDKALKSGFVVVTQVGNHIEQISPK